MKSCMTTKQTYYTQFKFAYMQNLMTNLEFFHLWQLVQTYLTVTWPHSGDRSFWAPSQLLSVLFHCSLDLLFFCEAFGAYDDHYIPPYLSIQVTDIVLSGYYAAIVMIPYISLKVLGDYLICMLCALQSLDALLMNGNCNKYQHPTTITVQEKCLAILRVTIQNFTL